jgi:hypothetical protein
MDGKLAPEMALPPSLQRNAFDTSLLGGAF